MALNFVAETSNSLDFTSIHKEIYSENLPFDFIPMRGLGKDNGDAIGICVPIKNANQNTWNKLEPILVKLKNQFACNVYDLYSGQQIDSSTISSIRQLFIET